MSRISRRLKGVLNGLFCGVKKDFRKSLIFYLLKINSSLNIVDSFNFSKNFKTNQGDTFLLENSENYLILLHRDNKNKLFKLFVFDENFNIYYSEEFKNRILKTGIKDKTLFISSKYLFIIKLPEIAKFKNLLDGY